MRSVANGCMMAVLTATMIVIAFAAGFATNSYYSIRAVPASAALNTTDTVTQAVPPANFGVFWEAWDLLKREFYGDLPQGQAVTYAAIRGILSTLGDPNTVLVEPVQHQREKEEFSGEFGGIGAFVATNEQGQLIIVSPIDDTPAARADLRADDIILKVDGKEITGLSQDDAVNLIRGPVGTEVTLEIQRPGQENTFTVTLTREKIPDPTVDHSIIKDTTIGYIRMRFFSARTPEELDKAIGDLKAKGATKLILDLRNNPGGLLDSAIVTASQFLDSGIVAYQQSKDGSRQELAVQPGGLALDIPLVVLVNEGSASASEIVAGALQDHGRAKLVGHQTFGKGTVQIPFTLSDGSSLHVTIAHWLTPNGTDLSQQGLAPDVWVDISDDDRQAGRDPQVERALDLIQNGQ
ncbi:MAG: S41 family peptidase [Ardenticatenaceae bacterium]|nr:S41 family peptidase [Ardenticatenaceae bacterium]